MRWQLPILLALVSATALPAAEPPDNLTSLEKRIVAAIDAEDPRTRALLERLANQNSGTKNLAGVRAVAAIMQTELEGAGFHPRWIPLDREVQRAGHLIAEHVGLPGGKRLLLIGHLDTVFELSSPFQKFAPQTAGRAVGPGVEDMKGGLAVLVAVLRALHATGALDAMNIRIVLTGDEENPGEPLSISRRHLFDAAKESDVALEFEPGIRVNGRDYASTSRRGVMEWQLKVRGVTGHSSQINSAEMGAGASNELTRILSQFASELPEKYLTYNVGLIVSGTTATLNESSTGATATGKMNVIPGEALAMGDLRMLTLDQTERAQLKMRAIVSHHLPKTEAEITFRGLMPPMAPEKNKGVLALWNDANRALGLEPMEELDPMLRGGGDISFVAGTLEGLTGLGAVGSGAHAEGEWVDLNSLSLQAKRDCLLLLRLTGQK